MSALSDRRALVRYFRARLGEIDEICHTATPWHSATFEGTRHLIAFNLPASVDAEVFVRDLGEAEIPLTSGFVADAMIASIERIHDKVFITVEALTIDAA